LQLTTLAMWDVAGEWFEINASQVGGFELAVLRVLITGLGYPSLAVQGGPQCHADCWAAKQGPLLQGRLSAQLKSHRSNIADCACSTLPSPSWRM
jgi:hypothetical protein